MNELELARQEINAVDQEMAALFERRMKAAQAVIAYKMAHDLPIFDSAREAQVVQRNSALIQTPELVEYYKEYLVSLMDLSKRYQKDILERTQK